MGILIPVLFVLCEVIHKILLPFIYSRGPQPPGCRRVLVRGLLGTGPHGRRWAAGGRVKLHLPLPSAPPSLALPPEPSPHTHTHPPPVEKLSSVKLVPGAKKVGDRWLIVNIGITNMFTPYWVYVLSHLTLAITLWNRCIPLNLYTKTFISRELSWLAHRSHNY